MKDYQSLLSNYSGRPLRIMEVCGTHTHEIFRLGIRSILSKNIELISGPGCPVCVTPPGYIDSAVELALKHKAVIATFGDLIRVPGSEMSLAQARTQGAALKTVYSPLDAVDFAVNVVIAVCVNCTSDGYIFFKDFVNSYYCIAIEELTVICREL